MTDLNSFLAVKVKIANSYKKKKITFYFHCAQSSTDLISTIDCVIGVYDYVLNKVSQKKVSLIAEICIF